MNKEKIIKKLTEKRILWLVFMIIMMVIIFLFSSQTADESSELSDYVAEVMYFWTPPFFELRKWAHIFEFAILGIAANGYFRDWKKTIIFCYLYACTDEIHQIFVLDRSAQITDTFIDAIGFVFTTLAWELVDLLKKDRQFILKYIEKIRK